MALEIPSQYSYSDYLSLDGESLRQFLLRDSSRNLRWRSDSSERLHGGARRTYLPGAPNTIDRLLFGASKEFRRAMHLCCTAANQLMSEVIDPAWKANRIVINKMPPGEELSQHVDPQHFANGVVVIGLGEADLMYEYDNREVTIHNPAESLMIIPPGIPHRVENGNLERISIVLAHDMQLAAGKTAVGQFFRNSFHISD